MGARAKKPQGQELLDRCERVVHRFHGTTHCGRRAVFFWSDPDKDVLEARCSGHQPGYWDAVTREDWIAWKVLNS